MDTHEQLRLALQALRRKEGLTESALAKAMDVNKSTIYRTEDTQDRPDYQPSLDTIEKWLAYTSGESLAEFFCRVEHQGVDDLKTYFALRSMLRDLTAYIATVHRKVQELNLPRTTDSFLSGFERRLNGLRPRSKRR